MAYIGNPISGPVNIMALCVPGFIKTAQICHIVFYCMYIDF